VGVSIKESTVLDEKLGLSIVPVKQDESFKEYIRVNADDFERLNACFRDVPYILKNLNDTRFYSGSYKVVYDKGLGVLQKSAKDPNFLEPTLLHPEQIMILQGRLYYKS